MCQLFESLFMLWLFPRWCWGEDRASHQGFVEVHSATPDFQKSFGEEASPSHGDACLAFCESHNCSWVEGKGGRRQQDFGEEWEVAEGSQYFGRRSSPEALQRHLQYWVRWEGEGGRWDLESLDVDSVQVPEGPEGVDRVDPWLRSWSTCILKICCKKMPCCLLAFLGTRMLWAPHVFKRTTRMFWAPHVFKEH